MRAKKTVTLKVVSANRANSKKGTGPKTQRGKEVVSQNATRHGILSRNFHFKDDQEESNYSALITDLHRNIDEDDPFQRMLTEVIAVAHFRRGRALRMEQSARRQQNPATELVLKTMENSKLLDTGLCLIDSESGWDCNELTMAAKKADDRELRNGPLAQSNRDGQQLQLHAKFQDPMEKALRYQRAIARDFYSALNWLNKLRRIQKQTTEDPEA
jgi:hypothetical protein